MFDKIDRLRSPRIENYIITKCPIFLDTRDQCLPGPLLPVPEPLNRAKALGTRLNLTFRVSWEAE
jgi:hypothetical protein